MSDHQREGNRHWPVRRSGGQGTLMISDTPVELEEWVKEEADRRKRLGLPRTAIYNVICDAIGLLQAERQPGPKVYYVQGLGPFLSTHEALDHLNVPDSSRGANWHQWSRLPEQYKSKIEMRDVEPEAA